MAAAPLPPAVPSQGPSARILFVETSADYAAAICETLRSDRKRPLDVDHTDSIDQATDRLEREEYDALLLDLSGPRADECLGFVESCTLAGNLPVLVLTDDEDTSLARTAVEAGASQYIVKDEVDRTELPVILMRAIKRHREHERLPDGARPADAPARAVLEDPLTGLPNALVFQDCLEQGLAHARRRGRNVGCAVIHLDSFDVDGDGWANEVSDEIVLAAVHSLGERLRPGDTIARIGPNSFGLVLDPLSAHQLEAAAKALLSRLKLVGESLPADRDWPRVVATIGLAAFPVDGNDPERLVHQARKQSYAAADVLGPEVGKPDGDAS